MPSNLRALKQKYNDAAKERRAKIAAKLEEDESLGKKVLERSKAFAQQLLDSDKGIHMRDPLEGAIVPEKKRTTTPTYTYSGAIPNPTIVATPAAQPTSQPAAKPTTPYASTINAMADKYNVPRELLTALVQKESQFNPRAVSEAGAQGLTQLMPGTAKDLGVTNPFDPVQSIEGGAKYLSQQMKAFPGRTDLALAAYNAGPGNVREYKGIPPFKETRNYVKDIMTAYNATKPKYEEGGSVHDDKYKKYLSNWYESRPIVDKLSNKTIQNQLKADIPYEMHQMIDNDPGIKGQFTPGLFNDKILVTPDTNQTDKEHEWNHAARKYALLVKGHDAAMVALPNVLKSDEDYLFSENLRAPHEGDPLKAYYYLREPEEIQTRLMRLRYKAGFEPTQKVEMEDLHQFLKNYKGDDQQINELLDMSGGDKSTLWMLNMMSAVGAQGEDTAYAASGGAVRMAEGGDMKSRLMSTLAGESDLGLPGKAGSSYKPTVEDYITDSGKQTVSSGLLDMVNRGLIASTVGAPVDMVNMAVGTRWPELASDKPVMGSEWIGDRMEAYGLVSPTRRPVGEAIAGFIDPETMGLGAAKLASSPIFFSRLGRAVESASPKAFTTGRSATEWLLSNLGKYSKAEVEATGLADRLAQMGKTSKEEVLQMIHEGQPQTTETWLGEHKTIPGYVIGYKNGPDIGPAYKSEQDAFEDLNDLFSGRTDLEVRPGSGDRSEVEINKPKFSQPDLQLPGGENYRELTFRFPQKERVATYAIKNRDTGGLIGSFSTSQEASDFFHNGPRANEFANGDYTIVATDAGKEPGFTEGHYEPNTWGHVRMTDRTDAEGNKVLFVEELQSDWSRAGKDSGFGRKEIKLDETDPEAIAGYNFILPNGDKVTGFGKTVDEAKEDVYRVFKQSLVSDVPKAPYVTDVGQWTEQGIKHIMHHAAEQGYDRVAFINGAQTADRYGLSKYIDNIEVHSVIYDDEPAKRVHLIDRNGNDIYMFTDQTGVIVKGDYKGEKLSDVLGSELSNKILRDEGRQIYESKDLSIGGEGLKNLYDVTIPSSLKKALKPLGGKVENMAIGEKKFNLFDTKTNNFLRNTFSKDAVEKAIAEHPGRFVVDEVPSDLSNQLGVTITPEMRKRILSEGQSSFKKGGSVKALYRKYKNK